MKYYKILFITNLILFLIIPEFSNAQGIIALRENNNLGIPVNENSIKTVSGIVTASNEYGSNGAGYIQDNQAGIGVYGSGFISQLSKGDSITITAKVTFYRGLTQLTFVEGESVLTIHKNTNLPEPETVTIADILNQNWNGTELLEGKLLRIDNVTIVETGTFAGNISYQITDGTNTLTLRIDGDTDIGGSTIPSTEISVVGCLSQFDSSEPYSSGYQLMPRNKNDIIQTTIVADFSADNTFGNLPLTVNFTDLSLNNPKTWLWNFGDGNTSTSQNPQHTYTAVGVYTVSLTVGDGITTNAKVKTDYITVVEGRLSTTSDNFIFYYKKPNLCTDNLIATLEKKFNNLDYILREISRNIYLLDRSQKVKVFLYDTDETFLSPPADLRDWDIGYYLREENELHIKVPTSERQLKYFPTFEKAAISILARYIIEKKRTTSNEIPKGLSFGFGLYESGYSPDLSIIRTYLEQNNNTFPDRSTFSTWAQLDDEINVEIAYTHLFASILGGGYLYPIVHDGLYDWEKDNWYQKVRTYFLLNIEDGGMRKFVEEDDFIIYTHSQEEADLVLEGLRWYADLCEDVYGVRINHPVLVAIVGYYDTGNLAIGGGAFSHNFLISTTGAENFDTELNRIKAKHNDTMEHEFTHNIIGFLMETAIPSWLNEGAAMNTPERRVYGYIGFNVQYFAQHHKYWNDKNMLFPDLDNAFTDGAQDPGFGYHMSYSAFTFLKDHVSREVLIEFIKRSDDYSIIGYSGVDEFQRHLYETLYHQYMPTFLFNPHWNLGTAFTPGTNFTFNWDGHYIEDLKIEYSVDKTKSWSLISEVSLSTNSYSWKIPETNNCILRFSDKKFPEINFTYQICGDKPALGKILYMPFQDGSANSFINGNNGRLKGNVSFTSRGGADGSYAKFDGRWDVINIFNYPELSLNEEWTIQGDFMIENTTGLTNKKPVLLNKMATLESNKNYAISFNKNRQNHLFFEYDLENNSTVSLEIDNAGITEGNWYTFYFARSVENNIVEARVYDQSRNLIDNTVRQINGEGKVLTGAGDLYLSTGDFDTYEQDLQGGLDNIIIADTYFDKLMSNSMNNAPIVSNIDNQTVNEGESFGTIRLDDFVSDTDNTANEMSWSYSGNVELSIDIDINRIATISILNSEWYGNETITFTATDPEGDSGSRDVLFTVSNVNDGPVISNIADQTIDEGSSFATIKLDDFVTDIDNDDSDIIWTFSGNNDLSVEIDENRIATITTPNEDWFGDETISFTAKDPSNVSSSKDVKFKVNAVNDLPRISGAPELIEFVSDTSYTIDIWDLISDIETSDDLLINEFSIDSDSIFYSYNDQTGILLLSAEIKFGGEGNLSWSVSDSEATVADTIRVTIEKAIVIGVVEEMIIPDEYVLHQNYPNPFNPSTMIKYGLPEQSNIKIEIFSMLGQRVGLLVNSEKSAGYHETIWDASNLPSGIYLISIKAEGLTSKMDFTQVKKALLLK